jgi:hypothetical protein
MSDDRKEKNAIEQETLNNGKNVPFFARVFLNYPRAILKEGKIILVEIIEHPDRQKAFAREKVRGLLFF